jgi:hypothetical protein
MIFAPPRRSGLTSRKFDGNPAANARPLNVASLLNASTTAYGCGLNRASGVRYVLLRKLVEVYTAASPDWLRERPLKYAR